MSIHFEGIDVNSGKQLAAKIWQAKLGSAQSLSLIGDEFGVLSLPFMALKDRRFQRRPTRNSAKSRSRPDGSDESSPSRAARGHGPGADICRRARLAAAARNPQVLRCDSRAGIRGFRHR